MLLSCWVALGHAHAQWTGMAVWSEDADKPQYATWDSTTFGATGDSQKVGIWRIIAGAAAPTRDEVIVLGVDGNEDITAEMWDGGAWSTLPFSFTVSYSYWWGFAVAYEQTSGDAVVVSNNGGSGFDGLSYYVWNGTAWSPEDTIAVPLAGEPVHLRLAASPISDMTH